MRCEYSSWYHSRPAGMLLPISFECIRGAWLLHLLGRLVGIGQDRHPIPLTFRERWGNNLRNTYSLSIQTNLWWRSKAKLGISLDGVLHLLGHVYGDIYRRVVVVVVEHPDLTDMCTSREHCIEECPHAGLG